MLQISKKDLREIINLQGEIIIIIIVIIIIIAIST